MKNNEDRGHTHSHMDRHTDTLYKQTNRQADIHTLRSTGKDRRKERAVDKQTIVNYAQCLLLNQEDIACLKKQSVIIHNNFSLEMPEVKAELTKQTNNFHRIRQ